VPLEREISATCEKFREKDASGFPRYYCALLLLAAVDMCIAATSNCARR